MEFDWWETELLRYFCVLDFFCVLEGETLDSLGHVRARRNGTPAAERLKLDVRDDTILVDTNLKLHDIAAPDDGTQGSEQRQRDHGQRRDVRRSTDQARTNIDVVLGERTDLKNRRDGRISYLITGRKSPGGARHTFLGCS